MVEITDDARLAIARQMKGWTVSSQQYEPEQMEGVDGEVVYIEREVAGETERKIAIVKNGRVVIWQA